MSLLLLFQTGGVQGVLDTTGDNDVCVLIGQAVIAGTFVASGGDDTATIVGALSITYATGTLYSTGGDDYCTIIGARYGGGPQPQREPGPIFGSGAARRYYNPAANAVTGPG